MKVPRFNWPLWAGFLLSVIAFLSYFLVFVWFPVTRDFPWANLLLFAFALALVVIGVRRAFGPERPRPTLSKIAAAILTTLSVAILGFFVFSVFIMARHLPASGGAPRVGQKAPDFSLSDTNGKQVSLSALLAARDEKAQTTPKGVLLIFYRGYW
jgi:flagellar biosynthesis component FlhA